MKQPLLLALLLLAPLFVQVLSRERADTSRDTPSTPVQSVEKSESPTASATPAATDRTLGSPATPAAAHAVGGRVPDSAQFLFM